MTNHDESCEINRVDWPQFKESVDAITGKTLPAGPYPCHCPARADGIAKAEREIARANRAMSMIDRALAPYAIDDREADLRKTRVLRKAARRTGGPR